MVTPYPDRLKFMRATTPQIVVTDDNGFKVVQPSVEEEEVIPCRAEVNSKGQTVPSEDGQNVNFGFIVYMPTGYATIPQGKSIEIYRGAELIAEGTVKRFFRSQLTVKAWV